MSYSTPQSYIDQNGRAAAVKIGFFGALVVMLLTALVAGAVVLTLDVDVANLLAR